MRHFILKEKFEKMLSNIEQLKQKTNIDKEVLYAAKKLHMDKTSKQSEKR